MIRALFDTNVLVSCLVVLPRLEQGLMHRWEGKDFQLIVSDDIMTEVVAALAKPYFQQRLPSGVRERSLARVRRNAAYVDISEIVHGVAPDPQDDHVLAAAVSSGADDLVTGDRALLSVGTYRASSSSAPASSWTSSKARS